MVLPCRNNATINAHVKTQNRVKHRVWHTDPWPDPTQPKSLIQWPVTQRPGSVSDWETGLRCILFKWCVGFGSRLGREIPSDLDAMLRLHNVVCAARTRRFTSWDEHLECSGSTAGVCQGSSQDICTVFITGCYEKCDFRRIAGYVFLDDTRYLHSYCGAFIHIICQMVLLPWS